MHSDTFIEPVKGCVLNSVHHRYVMSYFIGLNTVIEEHHYDEKLINETLSSCGMLFLGPALFYKSTQNNSVGGEI